MKPRMVGMLCSAGLAALLAGAGGAAPAAATASLHVVPSPVITNSCLSGAAVIASTDMWTVGDIGTGTGCNPFQTVGGGSGPFQTLAEHFNGTSWSVTEAPDPAGSPLNGFFGVAAVSPASVWAAGSSSPGNGTSTPLVEHFDGTSWTVQPAPSKAGSALSLAGITSTSSGQLWAVGGSYAAGSTSSQTLTARYS